MASTPLSLLLFSLTTLLLLTPFTSAQSSSAPAPSSSTAINITGILDKDGQYTVFIRMLTSTQVGSQIDNQVNNSNQGMTVFCPTDNAFNNLPAGYLNNLTSQQQVILVLYHVVPQYLTLAALQTVSNPVRTQASGQDGGGVFGLYFSGNNNQVNVSTGIVETPVNNPLRQQFPLAMYEVDKVLIPKEFSEAAAPAPSPPAANTTSGSNSTKSTAAPSSSGSGRLGMGLGLVAGFGLLGIGLLS